MEHSRIHEGMLDVPADIVPANFVLSFAICLVIGIVFWSGVFLAMR